ncbi:MAG: zinc-binding dehydrogenase [Candidatus Competibacteraceae bacterium]|nr:zinc-binding dehydrogenase [Candidatus Competibacteraceae bacterium]
MSAILEDLHHPGIDPAGTMTAAVFTAPGRIELRETPIPSPGPGQVLVRLEGCGICASNLPVWEGRPWFDYPLAPGAPGHEGWGRIAALGEGVQGLEVGERVAVLSYHAYAQYDVAGMDQVVKLPPELEVDAFPGEPLGCAMNIFARCEIRPGQTVAIVGSGFLGALLTQLASRAGARVLALSRRPYALEVARACGAEAGIPIEDFQAAVTRVGELTGGQNCERVIEAAGLQTTLDLASSLTGERARLIIAGFHQDGLRQINLQQWNWQGLDVINAHERDPAIYIRGIERAVEAIKAGQLDPQSLYTHQVGLEELPRAFELMARRPEGFLKGLLIL